MEKIKDERAQSFINAAQNLLELMQQIESCNNESLKALYLGLADELENEITEAFESYIEVLKKGGCSVGEFVTKFKPFIDVLQAYQELKEGSASDVPFEELSKEVANAGQCIDDLPKEVQEDIKPFLEEFKPAICNRALIDRSPITRNLVEQNNEPFALNRTDNITLQIIDGYLEPYELEILEDITLCMLEGRITPNNRVIIPICRLYEAMRGGQGKKPSKKQQKALVERLNELERKIEIISNKGILLPEKYFGKDTVFTGGKFWILTFDEIYAKNRGQATTYLMLPNVPLICGILYEFGMFETVTEELKAIQEYNPEDGSYSPVTLTDQRIAIRQIVFSFVFKYRRTMERGETCSNKLNYNAILDKFDIKQGNRATPKRMKDFVKVVLDHLVRFKVITCWREYTNSGSNKPNGIEVFIERRKGIK